MLGSPTTPDRDLARDSAKPRIAFRTLNNVGIRNDISWLNDPAWRLPCQRFAAAVADGLAHDSGPVWFAIPSLHWTLTNYSLPVSRRTQSELRLFGKRRDHRIRRGCPAP